jgi:hypothetical protein
MATPDRNGGALAGVRLTDVPLKTRQMYGRILLDRAIKEMEALPAMQFAAELNRAVEEPSDRIYWVPKDEVARVLTPKLRRR